MYQALYRKWRPKLFDDVVGQTHITRTLKRQIMTDHLSHAYLFTGTRGTGKTTCAKLMAKAVNCEHPVEGNPCGACPSCLGIDSGSILDVVELDAASNNGVDQVRALRDEAVYSPAAVKRRVYIIDEVHMLSVGAFNALLKILEEPPEHVMFILATTELHKVPATILSRCQRFSFKRIQAADIRNRLLFIAQAEHIDLTEDGAALLARLADGAMRDALSLLDQCAVAEGRVDRDVVLDALGLAGNTKTAHIMNDIRKGNTAQALNTLSELYAAGKDVSTVLSELSGLTRDLLLRMTAGEGSQGLMAGGYDEATMRTLSAQMTPQRLLHMLTVLQDTLAKLKNSANRRTDAEICIIRLCDRTLDGSVLSLSQRLSRVEAVLASGRLPVNPAGGQGEVPRPFAQPPRTAGQETAEEELPSEQMPQDLPPLEEREPPPPAEDALPPEWGTEATPDPVPPPVTEETPPPERTAEAPVDPLPVPAGEAIPEPPAPRTEPVPRTMTRTGRRQGGRKNRRPGGGGGDPHFWEQLSPLLLPELGMVARTFVEQKMVMGLYWDGVLTLYVPDPGVRQWLVKPEQQQAIERAAALQAGRNVRVQVEVGTPSPDQIRSPARGEHTTGGTGQTDALPDESQAAGAKAEEVDPMAELMNFAQTEGKGIVTID